MEDDQRLNRERVFEAEACVRLDDDYFHAGSRLYIHVSTSRIISTIKQCRGEQCPIELETHDQAIPRRSLSRFERALHMPMLLPRVNRLICGNSYFYRATCSYRCNFPRSTSMIKHWKTDVSAEEDDRSRRHRFSRRPAAATWITCRSRACTCGHTVVTMEHERKHCLFSEIALK